MGFDQSAQLAIDATFAAWGDAATYTPPGGGTAVPCVVQIDAAEHDAEPGQAEPIAGQVTLTVRKAEIAAPALGGTFAIVAGTFIGQSFDVMDRPRADDADRRVWKMWGIAP